MKIFISADIEGVTTTSFWKETTYTEDEYKMHAKQMTDEVIAACNGAIKAGATEIVINDAHEYGNNIDQTRLPECAKIIRGWSGHPYSMVDGLNNSFDGAIFIGYHSGAFKSGNPLSHTEDTELLYVKLNNLLCGEFDLYSRVCILERVPVLFISGDKEVCIDAKKSFPNIETCIVKEGNGASTINYNINKVLKEIEFNVEKSVKNLPNNISPILEGEFVLEVCYKNHVRAEKNSYYPGAQKINSNTLKFVSTNYFEILRTFNFIFK